MTVSVKVLFCVLNLHELVVPNDLHGHLLVGPRIIPGSDHVTEHALTRVAIHVVTLIQDFTYVHT